MSTDRCSPSGGKRALRRALEASRTVALVTRGYELIASVGHHSRPDWLSTAVERSRLTATTNWITDVTRNSVLYRWLTKEPEPEVIVIDLRETYTVGPVIAVVDWLVDALAPAWRTSKVRRAAESFAGLLEVAAESRTGATVAKLLEPPAPPDRSRDDRE